MEKISILIVNYNSSKFLIKCLDSIEKLKNKNLSLSVIIVDNNSSNLELCLLEDFLESKYFLLKESLAEINKFSFQIKMYESSSINYHSISLKENIGFAGGINLGGSYSLEGIKPDYLWILNPDVILEKNALKELIKKASSKKYFAIGSKITKYETNDIEISGGGKYYPFLGITKNIKIEGHNEELIEKSFDFIHGSSIFLPAESFKKNKGFNEIFFHYYEEIEFFRRSKDISLGYASKSIVHHFGGGSNLDLKKESYKDDFSIFYSFRSRLLFARLMGKRHLYFTFLIFAYSILRRVLFLRFNEIFIILRAISDGLKVDISRRKNNNFKKI